MEKHLGKRFFITGIPTAGKSYLAKKLVEKNDGILVSMDDFREKLITDNKYKDVVCFYLNQDEEKYLLETSPENQWLNLLSQSETLWPAFLGEIDKYKNEERLVVFESVNILPHLAKKDLDFSGLVLIGESFEKTFERNKLEPRWGETDYLQELEARYFFYTERPRYREEAEKYGYPVFESADEALEYLAGCKS